MICVAIKIILLSLSVTGWAFIWNYVLSPDQLLDRLGRWLEDLGSVGKPFGGCMTCNAFWVGVKCGITAAILYGSFWYLTVIPISFLMTLVLNKYIYG